MRSLMAIIAAVLAFVAALVSIADSDRDVVPFFLVLTVVAALLALLTVVGPWSGIRRVIGRFISVAWLVTALWIGGLLVMYQVTCACSSPTPVDPVQLYLGLPSTAYQLAATFGGATLVVVATFGGRRARTGPAGADGAGLNAAV